MAISIAAKLMLPLSNRILVRNSSTLPPFERLWRSYFYVPGDQEKKIAKMSNICDAAQVSASIPDVIVLDCDDLVATENKSLAHKNIASALQARVFDRYRNHLLRFVSLRINAPSTRMASEDIHVILSAAAETMKADGGPWPGPDYITIPKMDSVADLHWVESQVSKLFQKHDIKPIPDISLIGTIESPKSLVNVREICRDAQKSLKLPLVALEFGADNYYANLGVSHSRDLQKVLFARQYLVTMCRAHRIASLDMTENNLLDMEAFHQNCDFGARLGYDGKQLIHPKQIELANLAYSPSPELVEWATAVVEAAVALVAPPDFSATDAASTDGSALTVGVFAFRGQLIGRPAVRQAERIVAFNKLMHGL